LNRRRFLEYLTVGTIAVFATAASLWYYFGGKRSSTTSAADVVFTGGTIHLDTNVTTSVLAVTNGRVIATGGEAETSVGPNTRRVDLKGAHVFPGFQDSHLHLLEGSYVSTQLNLVGADTMSKIAERVSAYAAEHPNVSWIIGFGWYLTSGDTPSGVALDGVTSGRPMALGDLLGHNLLVNSAAMAQAGISDSTPDPAGGKIVRDPKTAKATGLLMEAAVGLVSEVMMKDLSDQEIAGGLEPALQAFAKLGFTGVNEVLGAPGLRMARPWLYTQLEKQGKLPLRIHYYVPIFSFEDIDAAVSFKDRYDAELVHFAGGKIWADGAMGSAEAWTSFPHINDPRNFGMHYFTPEQLQAMVARAEELHLPLQFHTNGDAAIEAALKALEFVVEKQTGLSAQHTLVHIGFVTAEQRRRIKQLGLVCSVQPAFWAADPTLKIAAYGTERWAEAYNFRALIDAGITLAMGSDWPVSPTADPRNVMGTGTLPPHGQSALTIAEIAKGYTEGSAQSVKRSDLGQLKPGFAADLVVLDQNPLQVTNENLGKIQVLETWVAGRRTMH